MEKLSKLLKDIIGPGPKPAHELMQTIVRKVLQDLPENEKKVLALFFMEDLTLAEMTAVLEMEEDAVSALYVRAIMYLRSRIVTALGGRVN